MRLPSRIVVPAAAALVVVVALLGFLMWQLGSASRQYQKQVKALGRLAADVRSTSSDNTLPTGDIALLRLRQGDLAALEGDWSTAEEEYRASVDAGGGVSALKKLAHAQLQRHEYESAQSTIERLRSSGGRPEDALLLEVLGALRSGDQEKAQQLLSSAEDSPHQHYGLALLAIAKGDHESAKQELQAVQDGWEPVLRSSARTLQSAYDEFGQFPDGQQIHLNTLLARALAQVQECDLALPLLASVTQSQADYRDAWIVQGYCALTTNRTDLAISSLERAYALDPEKPEIQYFLGRSYAARGDHKNAITYLEYALQNGFQPEKEVRKFLAAEALAVGDKAQALTQYRTIATSSGADIASVAKYVSVALEAGEKDQAYQTAKAATERWPDAAKAFDVLGWAAAATDRKDEARAAFEKAIQLDPTLEDAKEKLLSL